MLFQTQEERYIFYLNKQNGFCSCSALAELRLARETLVEQRLICSFLGRVIQSEPPKRQDTMNKNCSAEEQGHRTKTKNYSSLLNAALVERKIILYAHDVDNFCPFGEIPEEARRTFISRYDSPITAHCSLCEQQIEVLRTNPSHRS